MVVMVIAVTVEEAFVVTLIILLLFLPLLSLSSFCLEILTKCILTYESGLSVINVNSFS